nr:retrovirus-related Pol polyprotein from transposon TNT 1-94 [Tanacetum cinerariifolium]
MYYQELFNFIKITRVQTIDKTTSLQNEIENLKTQLKEKTPCVIIDYVAPKVLALCMYAIDVEPIPPRCRNNREVHLEYLKHLKESVATIRKNGEESRVERPLDSSLASACLYTKCSQELVEYAVGTAVATACYTQNRSLIRTLHNKTPYELVHDKKPDLSCLRVFCALCYPTNNSKDLGKLKAKAGIGLFVGYAPNWKGYRIYNKRTRQIMETIHVTFDELTGQTVLVQTSLGPVPNLLTPGPIIHILVNPPCPSVSISIDQDAPLEGHSPSSSDHQFSSVHHGVADDHSLEINPFAPADNEPFVNIFALDPNSEVSSFGETSIADFNQSTQPHEYL